MSEQKTIFPTEDAPRVATPKLAPKSHSEKTADGFRNFAAKLGVGTPGDEGSEDNLTTAGHYVFNLITRNRLLLEAAYRGSWIVGRVIDCVAEDMTKDGIIVQTTKGAKWLTEFKMRMSRLKIWSSVCDTIRWGRLYGGAIGVLQIKGQDLSTPLDCDTVGKDQFLGIAVYDRWQLNPDLQHVISVGPDMGLPEFYNIVLGNNVNDPGHTAGGEEVQHQVNATGQVRVHHTRCFRMGGHKLPFFQAITEMMWDEAVLERLWDRLVQYDTSSASVAQLILRANLRTVSIDGLRQILSTGGDAEEALIKQFEYMRMFQTNEGITLLDKEDEFASTAYTFAGLADVLANFGEQLSGAAETPLVRLFGQSPGGLNSDGKADLVNYYDSINAKQESKLRDPVETISKVMWRSMTGKALPIDFTFEFTPLWEMSAADKAAIATSNTTAIIGAHQEGLVNTSTAMKELKQSSGTTGLFSNITDEDIEDAEDIDPPMPEEEESEETEGTEKPSETVKKAMGDSAMKKWLKRFLNKDDFKESDHPRSKSGEFGSGGGGGGSSSSSKSLDKPEPVKGEGSKVFENDKDEAITKLSSVIKDKDWDKFSSEIEKQFKNAKVGKVTSEAASKIKRSHNFTFESDPDNEDMHGKGGGKRGKELKDPSIIVEFDGEHYALDGQHRLNKAIKSKEDANVAIVNVDFMKKMGLTKELFKGKKDFSTDGTSDHNKIKAWLAKSA